MADYIVAGKVENIIDTCFRKGCHHSRCFSRIPVHFELTGSLDLQESAETFISVVAETLPASAGCLAQIATARSTDPILQQLTNYCQEGQPAKHLSKVHYTYTCVYIVSFPCIVHY